MKKVNILGTLYTIYFDTPDEKLPEGCDGCMDQSIHQIRIAKLESSRNSLMNLKEYKKKVLRHEIIHAFLYESGLWNNSGGAESWGRNEEITDWIAIQSPKLFKAFKEADCL